MTPEEEERDVAEAMRRSAEWRVCLQGCRQEGDHKICRNYQDRPLVVGHDGKVTSYTRVTNYVKAFDDNLGLMDWKTEMALRGLAEVESWYYDLLEMVNADDKKGIRALAKRAQVAAGSEKKADTGTLVHGLTENIDRGLPLGSVPAEVEADLSAYEYATEEMEHLLIEQFVVNDTLKTGGSFDRLVSFRNGEYIADLKTGSVDYPGSMAMQLAVYAHSVGYSYEDHTRSELPWVDKQRAIIIHLPAGQAECTLYWIDIAKGWEAITTGGGVDWIRAWRRDQKNLLTPIAA